MRIPRKDPTLNDAIEALDIIFTSAQNTAKTIAAAVPLAWSMLTPGDLAFIDGELEHCVLDRRYFMENYYVIRDERGRMRTLYPFFSHQDILYEVVEEEWSAKGCCRLIVLKPRQAGSTTWNAALIFHATLFTPDAYSLMMAQDAEVSGEIYQRVIDAFHNLPWWMWAETMSKQQGLKVIFQRTDEQQQVTDPGLGSTLMISNAQKATGVAIGRCQRPDSYIWTSDGPLTLADIRNRYTDCIPEPDGVGNWYELDRPLSTWAFVNGQLSMSRITRVFSQHYQGPLQRIGTSAGVTIYKSPQHAVLVADKSWQNALHPDEFVSSVGVLPSVQSKHSTYPEEAELLAWQIGEGSESRKGYYGVYITQKPKEIRDRIESLVWLVVRPDKVVNKVPDGVIREAGKPDRPRIGYIEFSSREWKKSLLKRGHKWGKLSHNKEIPEFILNSDLESARWFLRAYFEAEGNVNHVVEICSTSRAIIEGLRYMLARFGIVLRFSFPEREDNPRDPKWHLRYRAYLGGPSLVKFYRDIGFLSLRKQCRLKATADKAKGTNCEVEPVATVMLRDLCKLCHVSIKYVTGSGRYEYEQLLTQASARKALDRIKDLCVRVTQWRESKAARSLAVSVSGRGKEVSEGMRFGRYVVQSLLGKRKNSDKLWLCMCDCGSARVVGSYELRKGTSQSCGCLTAVLASTQLSAAFKNFDPDKALQMLPAVEAELDSVFDYERVTGVESRFYSGELMDIEVEGGHSYPTSGVITHNTIRNVLGSEVSRWPDSTVWTADIKPSLNAPDMLGILESTAFGRSGLYWNMWKAAEDGKSIWRALFIPVYKVRKYSIPITIGERFTLTPDEAALRSAVQKREKFVIPLGFFKWRRAEITECINSTGSDETHKESYPITPKEAFISSGFCAFPKKELDRQEQVNCADPELIGEIEYTSTTAPPILHLHKPAADDIAEKPERSNRFWVWEPPELKSDDAAEYYIGSDVGGSGEGNDFSDAVVYKLGYGCEPDIQVAEWHGHINASHFAKVLAAIGHWYHDAEIAVEYARDGITTGNELQWVIDYQNIYRWRRMDKIGNTLTMHTHWMTNHQTRDDAINRVSERLLDHTIVIRNRHALDEMRDFGRYEGEAKAAGIDNNDDMVLAHLICIGASNQSGKRQMMEEARAMGTGVSSSEAATVMPRVPKVYGVYDHYGRQVCQVASESEGKEVIAACEKKYKIDLKLLWKIVPIQVMRCNTPWSAAWDSQGAEHDLYHEHGIDPKNQIPEIVSLYRNLLNVQRRSGADVYGGDDE